MTVTLTRFLFTYFLIDKAIFEQTLAEINENVTKSLDMRK